MKSKKIALALVGMCAAFTLAACSGGKELVTMKGDKITLEEFFDEIKTDQQVQGKLQNAIVFKLAENAYGDKVNKKEVQDMFDEQKKNLGDSFLQQLQASGFTEATYKEAIAQNLAFKKMQEAHVKLTDKDLKETWKTFHPEVEVQLFGTSDEEKAKEALKDIKGGKDFGKIAREKSEDISSKDKGVVKFDSSSMAVPNEIKEDIYKLKDGEVSEVLSAQQMGQQGPITTYYVVKMVKNKEKGNDMKPFKKELKQIATDAKLADATFVQKVIGEEMKKANVKMKDKSLDGIIASFITEPEKPAKTDKKADDKKSDKKDDKKSDKKDEKKDDKK